MAERGEKVTRIEPKEKREPRSWFVLKGRLPSDIQRAIKEGVINVHPLTAVSFLIFEEESLSKRLEVDISNQLLPQCLFNDFSTRSGNLNYTKRLLWVKTVISAATEISAKKEKMVVKVQNESTLEAEVVVDTTGPSLVLHRLLPRPIINDNPFVLWIVGAKMNNE